MSVIPVDAPPDTAAGTPMPEGFWRRLALALDEYFAQRTKQTLPEATLRRSRQDFERCRRLMHKTAMAPVFANVSIVCHRSASSRRGHDDDQSRPPLKAQLLRRGEGAAKENLNASNKSGRTSLVVAAPIVHDRS